MDSYAIVLGAIHPPIGPSSLKSSQIRKNISIQKNVITSRVCEFLKKICDIEISEGIDYMPLRKSLDSYRRGRGYSRRRGKCVVYESCRSTGEKVVKRVFMKRLARGQAKRKLRISKKKKIPTFRKIPFGTQK
ncbi:hypothetical protein PUN28_019654 [Cardiocondyla obscurior]|uniref:Uncharacterized protein n=1 Tax=Cardiocondyla obscurior TaxID=286306 RepID=A0AAW2EDL1_9HYME